jgi:hypothetical protein
MILFAFGLAALAAGEGSGQVAAKRVVMPSPNAEWKQVYANDGRRAFVDSHNISLANGLVRYVGRLVFDRPVDNGCTTEIVHLGEINCAAHSYRTIAFDMLGPNGALISSKDTPGEESPIGANSPNDDLYKQYCR